MSDILKIATRKSELALWQAHHVRDRLLRAHPDLVIELIPLTTQGVVILDTSLSKIGGKGLFVKELEQALLDGRADIAVHSMKDMPMDLPNNLVIGAVLAREDERDALVSTRFTSLMDLPLGARVGTSSLRRQAQIKALRPDVVTSDLRGNVNTRLKKLSDGHFDAIVLAAAGLMRLGLTARISQYFSHDELLPAAAQGAIAIECRDEEKTLLLVNALHDQTTATCVIAERVVNRILGGSCQVPIAAYARIEHSQMRLDARVCDLSGETILRAHGTAAIEDAENLGRQVTEQLIAQGARELLQSILTVK